VWVQTDCNVTPPPDVPTPADTGTCATCPGATEVAFCAAVSSTTCLRVQGCAGGCRTCTAAVTNGDNCGSPVIINARGRSRTIMSTCGLRDDVNTNCGTGGNDGVFALRLSAAGAYSLRVTTPPGVTASVGYDGPGRGCQANSGTRRCLGTGTPLGQSGVGNPGELYFYVATSQPATVVIDADLP
jgi:hypothetical protein